MSDGDRLRVLVIGAHPDDCEFNAGGIAALYAERGHLVRFVSVANGNGGHYEMGGAALARRRREEARRAAAVIGIESQVLDNDDCEIMPTLELRKDIIRLIREFQPDIIMTHRPTDYHPDHRYTSQVVQDAAYTLTVPNAVPLTDHMMRNPVILYLNDHIERVPLQPDIAVDITSVIEKKLDMLHCHESQMYEWLPYNAGMDLSKIPKGDRERRAWLAERYEERMTRPARTYRERLIEVYGEEQGRAIRYAEVFELCPFGSPIDSEEELYRLFPFLPRK